MTENYIYKFPSLKNGETEIKEKFLELRAKYRENTSLSPEEIDWMDWANNILYVMIETK